MAVDTKHGKSRNGLRMLAATGRLFALLFATTAQAEPKHGIAMHGEPALPADYAHFPYVNPDAPKGGSVSYGVRGSFDSLNPFVLKSMRTTARGVVDPEFGNFVFETLMQRSRDEPFTLYGLLAEKVETDEDRTWVEFTLNPKARWSDGKPVTPQDVIFTFKLFTDKGRPPYSSRMARIEKIEQVGENGVRFTLKDDADREFPLILGLSPVLPKHAIDPETFAESGLTPIIGSGPYLIDEVKPGERITYKRNPDYWGKDLPSMRGFFNFDTVRVEYFRDDTARFEAFKKGIYDINPEGDPVSWETAYDFPAVTSGDVIKATFDSGRPQSMVGMFFNTRKPVFADRKVREGLSMLLDFEWLNANLYGGRYARTGSFWQNSKELSALGRPADESERELLAPFPDAVSPAVMDGSWRPSTTDGSGRDRKVLRAALSLLQEAGYALQDRKLVKDGAPLAFEILTSKLGEEKIALAYKQTAALLGIEVSIRNVDDSQYQQRRQTWDYDMTFATLSSSLSPGAEQVGRWGSASRDPEGTFNYSGTADPAIDAMIDKVVNARERDDFAAAVRALDRVLISGAYAIPLYHIPQDWVAYRKKIGVPEVTPLYGYQLPAWWAKE